MLLSLKTLVCSVLFLANNTPYQKSASETPIASLVNKEEAPSTLIPLPEPWMKYCELQEFDKAVDELLCSHSYLNNPLSLERIPQIRLDRKVFDTNCIPLIEAYVRKMSAPHTIVPWYPDRWNTLFYRASCDNHIGACKLLWSVRHLSDRDCFNKIRQTVAEALTKNNITYIRWALEELRRLKRVDAIDKVKHVTFTLPHKSDECHESYIFTAAEKMENKDIVILLLQYGVDPSAGGEYPEVFSSTQTYYCRSWNNEMRSLIKTFFFVRPSILKYIKNSLPRANRMDDTFAHHNTLLARWAFSRCPGLASAGITDEEGNNPLHWAVLARNPQLIKICLHANTALLEIENNQGLTPLALAYAKNLSISLAALLDFCYAVHHATTDM